MRPSHPASNDSVGPEPLVLISGFDVVPNIDFSDDLAHNVTTKTFTVTRSQGVRIYAILIVIAVCECLGHCTMLTAPLSFLDRDDHDNVAFDLHNISRPRQGH